jgi:hypothetical protein
MNLFPENISTIAKERNEKINVQPISRNLPQNNTGAARVKMTASSKTTSKRLARKDLLSGSSHPCKQADNEVQGKMGPTVSIAPQMQTEMPDCKRGIAFLH